MVLSDGTNSLTLTDDLTELSPFWQPVVQAVTYTLTGAMLVDESIKLAGRPLTFQSEPNAGWVEYAKVEQLHRWACVPGKQLTLTRYGDSLTVVFNRESGQAVEAKPVLDIGRAPWPEDWMLLTLRLMTI